MLATDTVTSSFESEEINDDYIRGVDPDQRPEDGLMFQRIGEPPYSMPF